MSTREEVAEIDKFAMVLIFDVDDAPFVLSATDLLAINNDRLLTADNRKWDDVLDGGIRGTLLVVQFLVVIWVHLEVVEGELLLDALFERPSLFQRKRIGFRNDGDNVHNIGKLLQDDNVNGLESVARWLDEEQAAMNAGILNVSLSLCSEFLSEVGRVLVFDVLDNRVPTDKR